MVDYRKGGDGPVVDWWLYEDVAKPIPTVVACAGMPFEAHTLDAISYADMRPGCFDPAARLVDMDTVRVERSLCFPYVTRFAGQMFLEAKDKDLALRCVRAYNDWMIDEWCGDSGGRLVPVTLVPLWDADLAAAEVRRCAARAVASSRSPRCRATSASRRSTIPSGTGIRCSRPATRRGWCWGCTSGRGRRWPTSARMRPGPSSTALTFTSAQVSLTEWLVSGNLVRFPKLKIVYSESQIGWMPFVLDRLDKVWEHRAYAGIDPIVDQPPSTYMAGRIWGSFFDDDCGIEQRHRIGVSQLVLEMDYPHQDSTWPDTPKIVERLASQVTPEEFVRMTRTNALTMLGLE